MVKKQYLAPRAIVMSYDGADILTASGEEDGTKYASFKVSWLTAETEEE